MVTYSILTAIVASFPPEVNGVANTHLSAQRAGIAMIFMTSIFFSLSFGPVSWVLASEVSSESRPRVVGSEEELIVRCIGLPNADKVHWHVW